MPLFYFDSDDGDRTMSDDIGTECMNVHEARKEALRSLPEMARDVIPDGDRIMWVKVRDESGLHVFKATLLLTAEWLIEPTAE